MNGMDKGGNKHMDWPISWQKVKDNGGYEILDISDYGLGLDKGLDNEVSGTLMLDDMAEVIKSGKSIVVKVTGLGELLGLGIEWALVPAISYAFNENGELEEVWGHMRLAIFGGDVDIYTRIFRKSDGEKTGLECTPMQAMPSPKGTVYTKYVLTSRDGTMSWDLGDYLIDLSSVAVATGVATNIEDKNVNILNTYSQAGKNLTVKIKFIDPTDSENEVTQVVGLNLMVTNHTTSGATTMAYVGTVAGLVFNVYKENSHWAYSVTQLSLSETTNPSV